MYWIQERERIRLKKEADYFKPWSDDPVFQRTYFCNVDRENDRVTKWIRENWSPDEIGWDDYEYAMVLARFLNWPETLAEIVWCRRNPNGILRLLNMRAERGMKVWGNAYVITTHGIKMPKADYLCQRVLPAAYDLLGNSRWCNLYVGSPPTLAAAWERLQQLEGLGSFLAAQVVADLKNTVGHPLFEEAEDWWDWAAPGPGSMRGLEWFFGHRVTEKDFIHSVKSVREYAETKGGVAHYCLQNIQNCLCEYDKYMRVRNNTGRSKRNYPGV